jgi:hypothetical protein
MMDTQTVLNNKHEEDLRRSKIHFVEVNVEDPWSNPQNEVVRHGALDMLLGIHGA